MRACALLPAITATHNKIDYRAAEAVATGAFLQLQQQHSVE